MVIGKNGGPMAVMMFFRSIVLAVLFEIHVLKAFNLPSN